MTKMILSVLIMTLASSMAFAKDCSHQLERHYSAQKIAVNKVQAVLSNEERAIYTIRANQQGGDFQDEAVVDVQTCKILATYNIWSE